MARPKLVTPTGEFFIPVLVDSAEQLPYTFAGMKCDKADGGGPLTIPTQRANLEWGDYSLLGFEKQVSIERKSHSDLFGTLGRGRDRFERELAALAAYRWAAVVIEASWEEICTTAPPHSEMEPKTVFRSILAWSVRYPRIHWFAAGPRRLAEVTTFRLLERFAKETLRVPSEDDTAEWQEPKEAWPTLEEITDNHLAATLSRCDGNRTRAAEMLGVSVKTVYNRLAAMEKRVLPKSRQQNTKGVA